MTWLRDRSRKWKNSHGIVAICIGNTFEWFDFVIFGFFAIPISNAFFPADSPAAGLLKTFAIFGVAFVARPIGAIVAGYVADRRGRRPSLIVTTTIMTTGTALIAVVPTHETIGHLATAIVLLGRILQGFSAGGEFGTATALLAEYDPARRGFYSSWQFAGQAATLVLVTAVGSGLSALLTMEQINAWGWRIPFLIGCLLGPIAIYIRSHVAESHEFRLTDKSRTPVLEAFSRFKINLLIATGLVVLATVSIYTLLFIPTFAVRYFHFSLSDALLASFLTGLIQVIVVPLGGVLSDRFGRRLIAGTAAVLIFVTSIPLLHFLILNQSWPHLLLFQLWLGALTALYAGGLPAMMSELFLTRIRTTGLSVSYAVSVALFGGASPFAIELAVQTWGIELAPAIWLCIAAGVSSVAVLISGRYRQSLPKQTQA